ncbi:Pleiotropic drug resistance protein 1, partial [Cucurbita argyrosperma subsp. argyrosperma]
MGALFFTLIVIMFNGFSELAMTVVKLPVFYKQRDLLFYPSWTYALPTWILKIPITCLEVGIWVVMTYYDVHPWWLWGYWVSPMMYGQNAIAVNEFLGDSWRHVLPNSSEPLGVTILKSRGIFPEAYWYWIGVGATIGYVLLFNFLFILALHYLDPFGKPQAVLSEDTLAEKNANKTGEFEPPTKTNIFFEREKESQNISSRTLSTRVGSTSEFNHNNNRGMVLPYEPHSITFDEIRYAVDMPQLFLLKRGGEAIFVGPIGRHSSHLIDYFEEKQSLDQGTKHASTRFEGLCMACLWKQHLSYWRNPPYTIVRLLFATFVAILFGTIFWDLGSRRGFPYGGDGTTGHAQSLGPYMDWLLPSSEILRTPFNQTGISGCCCSGACWDAPALWIHLCLLNKGI